MFPSLTKAFQLLREKLQGAPPQPVVVVDPRLDPDIHLNGVLLAPDMDYTPLADPNRGPIDFHFRMQDNDVVQIRRINGQRAVMTGAESRTDAPFTFSNPLLSNEQVQAQLQVQAQEDTQIEELLRTAPPILSSWERIMLDD
jgi:hypothetical protein